MHVRRALPAMSVLFMFLTAGPFVAVAQTEVEEATHRADQARGEVDRAYDIVTSAVANRDEIEAQLAATLDRYATAGADLAAAHQELDRIGQSLAFADARAIDVERSLEDQTVAAYMEAVTSGAFVLDTTTVEDALVVNQLIREAQEETYASLDELLARRSELVALRENYEEELTRVSGLQLELENDAAALDQLFALANVEVAAAFVRAQEADSALRTAMDDVERARAVAAEKERRRLAAQSTTSTSTTTTSSTPTTSSPPTTTTTPPSTTSSPGTTVTSTTTTVPPSTSTTTSGGGSSITIRPQVEAWRPMVTQHFSADLVEDALVIIQCESLGDPEAVNPYSGASGLFQFMPGTWAVASVQAGVADRSVFDGEANIMAASWLAEYYRSRGYDPWRPWSCRTYL